MWFGSRAPAILVNAFRRAFAELAVAQARAAAHGAALGGAVEGITFGHRYVLTVGDGRVGENR